MPASTINTITLLVMSVQIERNYLISYMLLDGLEKLVEENEEEIKSACARYAKLPNGGTPEPPVRISFQISRPFIKRIVHLVQWVKDRDRLSETIYVDSEVTREDLLPNLQEAQLRFEFRKDQKKVG